MIEYNVQVYHPLKVLSVKNNIICVKITLLHVRGRLRFLLAREREREITIERERERDELKAGEAKQGIGHPPFSLGT